ncbi:hypothetical protein [Endozoicomonas sp. ALD040]|uniref:hypothetical protein n=1 Tax=Endozoicomonas sp. ALD040 TaxID=3403079 RepID=UPI003BB108C0
MDSLIMKSLFFLFITFITMNSALAQNDMVLVISDTSYASLLEKELEVYKNDLESEGWNVNFLFKDKKYYSYSEFHKELVLQHSIQKMKGVVLIGNFPYEDDHLISCSECTFANSFFFSIKPDFWVSRIDPSLVTNLDNVALLKNYFKRNHEYRKSNYYWNNHINAISSIESYHDTINYYIHALYSLGSYLPNVVYSTDDFWKAVNESNATITEINVHGNRDLISVNNQIIKAEEILYNSHSKSRFIDLYSCYGGFPDKNNIASAFLFSPFSRVLAVSARSDLASINSQVHAHYVNSMNVVIGESFIKNYSWANHALPYYNGRILLGDGTLKLKK